jgi:hypothetical protein
MSDRSFLRRIRICAVARRPGPRRRNSHRTGDERLRWRRLVTHADPGRGRMEGHGYYTSHSEAQQAYGELGIEWLEQAAAEVSRR